MLDITLWHAGADWQETEYAPSVQWTQEDLIHLIQHVQCDIHVYVEILYKLNCMCLGSILVSQPQHSI